ncbi:hypothetical protein Tco_0493299 [Tanacetum coccineum]
MSTRATHNEIIEGDGKYHAPMLVVESYVHYPEVLHAGNNLGHPAETKHETYSTVNEHIKKRIDAEAEEVHIKLTWIDNDIYSTMDACAIAKEIWFAIESLVQGENINKQDVETNLFWAFGKFTSRDGQDLKEVSYHTLLDILKQHQNEVNEIQAERLARNANPLALITRVPSPPPESDHEVVSDEDDTPRDKEIAKLMALISTSFKKIYKPTNNNIITSSNTRSKNVDNTQRTERISGYEI